MIQSLLARRTRAPLLALAAIPLFAVSAAAQVAPSFSFVIKGTAEGGGDPVATVEFTDGETQDIDAGQGVSLSGGGVLRPSWDSPLGVRATVGFKYVTEAADNVNITLTRVPIEVVGTYNVTPDVWIGGGVVHHTAIKFRTGGLGGDEDLEDATGATAEVGWRWISLSYTGMTYTDSQGGEYDASSVGVSLVWIFGR